MTLRGQLTLAAGLFAVSFGVGFWLTPRLGAVLARALDAPPPVAAGPPAPASSPGGASWFDARGVPEPTSAALPLPQPPVAPAVPESVLERLPPSARLGVAAAFEAELARGERIAERIEAPVGLEGVLGPLELEYALDPELNREAARVFRDARVELGHLILIDPVDGRVLAYVSTDPERFPATRAYPMASLMKVVTAAAALRSAPEATTRPCLFVGSPYSLNARLLDPPRGGHVASFERALATSNNQCFARIAVHELGALRMFDELASLGVVEPPAPGHPPGEIDPLETRLDLGELGSGLAGSRLPPLGAARLAAALADGQLVTPRWIERVTDANGLELELLAPAPRAALDPSVTQALRSMLVETTVSGTARRAFRGSGGRPLLEPVRVAGKTGSLSGRDPDGHYEWFIGVAPAEAPRVAVAALIVNRGRWRLSASQAAAQVLRAVFCRGGACSPDAPRETSRDARAAREEAPRPQPAPRVG